MRGESVRSVAAAVSGKAPRSATCVVRVNLGQLQDEKSTTYIHRFRQVAIDDVWLHIHVPRLSSFSCSRGRFRCRLLDRYRIHGRQFQGLETHSPLRRKTNAKRTWKIASAWALRDDPTRAGMFVKAKEKFHVVRYFFH